MTKEDFESNIEIIDKKMKLLFDQKRQLIAEYIEQNRKFADKEKVKIIDDLGNCRHAFVVGYDLYSKGKLRPRLKKCTKDGTVSLVNDWRSRFETIHKLN